MVRKSDEASDAKKRGGRNNSSQNNRQNERKKMDNNSKNYQPQTKFDAQDSELSTDFTFGYHASAEALSQGKGNKLFLQEDAKGEKIQRLKELAKEQSVPVKWVPKVKLDDWSSAGVHQGIVLATTPYEYLELDDLLTQAFEKTDTPFFLILDSIEDPHNFGSILRTADASGVNGVIIPKHRAVGITPVVAKASTGAVEHVPIARITNLSQGIQRLKEKSFWIFGTDMSGTDYRKWNSQGAIALIIGNEGKGISQGLKKEVDEMLTIPMVGHVQSLNASVAAGLLMYQAFSQRGGDTL